MLFSLLFINMNLEPKIIDKHGHQGGGHLTWSGGLFVILVNMSRGTKITLIHVVGKNQLQYYSPTNSVVNN